MKDNRFPHCQLHDTTIVTGFAKGCPLSFANPLDRLSEYRSRMYWKGGHDDPHRAVTMGQLFDTCNACVDAKLRDPHVKHLRNRKGLQ